MTHSRADKPAPAGRRATWLRSLSQAVIYALAALFALSHAGCASKPTKQPSTVQEFLSQPRPQ